MVMIKSRVWAVLVVLCLGLGMALWGVSWRAKAQVQAEVIKGLDARLEALETGLEKVRKQAALDRQQAQARAKASAAQAKAEGTVKEKLNATDPVHLPSADADSLREYIDALNVGIRSTSSVP